MAAFAALMRSSTLAASESYFTSASWFAKETSASLTPFTFSSADCTAVVQEPHVIPLISSVTVSSLASALREKTSPFVSTTKAANNALRQRLKQAHDPQHEQIWIRRGRCRPATRHLPCCPTGRRPQATTASTAGNKPGSCCAKPMPTGNDPFPTSPTRRDRQTRLPCDAGLDACCIWEPCWRRRSGRRPAGGSRLHPPSLPNSFTR